MMTKSSESLSASPAGTALRVVKFGGSSMATADAMRLSAHFLRDDPARRFAVVSAPGKAFGGSPFPEEREKITDLLIAGWEGDSAAVATVQRRFRRLAESLDAGALLREELDRLPSLVGGAAGKDHFISRGEYLSAKLFAFLTGLPFYDAASLIFFQEDGRIDEKRTETALRETLLSEGGGVIPGFYGSLPGGTVKTFPRGGSDVTGALVAAALDAVVYENRTDVDGLLEADPRIVSSPRRVPEITYENMRELSLLGAAVLHEDAVLPVRKKGIPIEIGNTFSPGTPGTAVVRGRGKGDALQDPGDPFSVSASDPAFCVSGKGGFTLLSAHIEDPAAVSRTLSSAAACFADCGIPIFLLQSGAGGISALLDTASLAGKRRRLLHHLARAISPAFISLQDGAAAVTVVCERESAGIEALLSAVRQSAVPLLFLSANGKRSPIACIPAGSLHSFLRTLYRVGRQKIRLSPKKNEETPPFAPQTADDLP